MVSFDLEALVEAKLHDLVATMAALEAVSGWSL